MEKGWGVQTEKKQSPQEPEWSFWKLECSMNYKGVYGNGNRDLEIVALGQWRILFGNVKGAGDKEEKDY